MIEISMEANETRIAQAVLEQRASTVAEYGVYVGLDVHKDMIAVAVAPAGRSSTPASWARSRTSPRRSPSSSTV